MSEPDMEADENSLFSGEMPSVEDIARDLGVAEDTVRSWIRERKLPGYQVGKEYRIKIVDYERFLQQRRTVDKDFQEGD